MPRGLLLGLAGLFVFVAVAALMVKVMPEPFKDFDYMVIGSVATLVALLAVFVMLISNSSNVFFKRRKK